jgi:hypothetical protein
MVAVAPTNPKLTTGDGLYLMATVAYETEFMPYYI